MSYVAPQFKLTAFNCPHCGAYAHQSWELLGKYVKKNDSFKKVVTRAECAKCMQWSIWHYGMLSTAQMIYPQVNFVELPKEDMPDKVKDLYVKAAKILQYAPEASAAMLRKALELLCMEVGANGKDLKTKINKVWLDLAGRDPVIGQALDIIRNYGNEGAHAKPVLNLDEPEMIESVTLMFELLNEVVETVISKPKRINHFYQKIPHTRRDEAIAKHIT